MPIYEYYCTDCKARFEVLRPKSKSNDVCACKNCAGTQTTRLISLFAAHSNGRALAGTGGGCAGCAPSGACATCSR